MRRLVAALAGVVAVGAATPAAAWQDRVLHTDHLAIDRPVVDLSGWHHQGDEPLRVELRGTITNGLDGTTLDAASRWNGDTRLTRDDPWVVLPEGARLVEQQPEAHRYLYELPRGRPARVELLVRRLAHEHFVTPSELGSRTVGSIEVRVLAPVAVHAGTAAAPRPPGIGRGLPLAALALGAAGVPLGLVVLLGVTSRRRRREDVALMRRARAAVRAIELEARALGPAFDDVSAASRRMLDGAAAVQRHLHEVRAAKRRTRRLRSAGARERRRELGAREDEALARLRDLADRLETTATRLAAHAAGTARAPDVAGLVGALDSELDVAVTADTEAHQ